MRLNETRETLVNKKTPIYLNNKMLSFVIYAGYESHDFAEKEINRVLFFSTMNAIFVIRMNHQIKYFIS